MDFDLLNQTYDRMSAMAVCDDPETINELAEQTAHSVGAVSYALIDFRSTDDDPRIALASPRCGFADVYAKHGMERLSPVPHALKRLRRPVNREVVAREEQDHARLLTAFLSEIGAEDFCIAPVFRKGAVVGGLGFQFASGPSTSVAAGIAGLVAPVLYEASEKVFGGEEQRPRRNPLTPRELECLIWSADGKTSWEISEILSVSERTVNAHLGRAIRKLGVVSRTQAVAEAMRRGLFR